MVIEEKTANWICSNLGEIGEPKMCKRILKEQTKSNGDVPFYKIGTFGKEADAYISKSLFEWYKNEYSYPKKGDVLLSAAGTIGRAVVFDGKDSYFQDSNIVWIENDESKMINKYLYYLYNAIKWKAADGGTVSRLYNNLLKSTEIKIPPLAEQKSITIVLSDIDNLIADLDKLILKKKAIKQGTMQDLLTGKKRLPGFNKKWKIRKLGDIAEMYSGGTPDSKNPHYYGGGIPWVSISDISNAGKYLVKTTSTLTDEGYKNSSTKMYPANTLLFAMYASIGKCCISKKSVCSSQAILGIYNLAECMTEFLYYNLTFRVDEFVFMGQTGTQSNLSKKIVEEIQIELPTIEEQAEIVTVLRDMDNEISSLEDKLQKYKNIKQGMMNKLLTGEIRLVEEGK